MSTQSRKLPVLALSACSIPVMLAFAGTGARSTGVQTPAVTSEDVSFTDDHHRDGQADAIVVGTDVSKSKVTSVAGCIANDTVSGLSAIDNSGESWMCMAPDGDHFWVANGRDSSIATYRFVDSHSATDQLNYKLVSTYNQLADPAVSSGAESAESGLVDLQLSEDGKWLYQVFEQTGTMAVYEVEGHKLELVETLTA